MKTQNQMLKELKLKKKFNQVIVAYKNDIDKTIKLFKKAVKVCSDK